MQTELPATHPVSPPHPALPCTSSACLESLTSLPTPWPPSKQLSHPRGGWGWGLHGLLPYKVLHMPWSSHCNSNEFCLFMLPLRNARFIHGHRSRPREHLPGSAVGGQFLTGDGPTSGSSLPVHVHAARARRSHRADAAVAGASDTGQSIRRCPSVVFSKCHIFCVSLCAQTLTGPP